MVRVTSAYNDTFPPPLECHCKRGSLYILEGGAVFGEKGCCQTISKGTGLSQVDQFRNSRPLRNPRNQIPVNFSSSWLTTAAERASERASEPLAHLETSRHAGARKQTRHAPTCKHAPLPSSLPPSLTLLSLLLLPQDKFHIDIASGLAGVPSSFRPSPLTVPICTYIYYPLKVKIVVIRN